MTMRSTRRAVVVPVGAGLAAAAAAAAADVDAVGGPVFVLASAVGFALAIVLAIARFQQRRGAGRLMALGVVGAVVLGGAAGVLDFASSTRAGWLWIGLGAAGASVAAWAAWRSTRAPKVTSQAVEAPLGDEPPPEIDSETVEVALENVRWVLTDEQARGQSLQTRATGLAGFGGIIISLLAAAASSIAQRQDLSSAERTVVKVFLAYGLILLIVAIAMLLLGVLATRRIEVTAVSELALYKKRAFMSRSAVWARGRITATLVDALAAERAVNNRRVVWLNAGASAVVAALVFVAAGALTLLL